ncbi:MAG: GtrA family protein [Candidatus Yanofskybacteria bacterium]|nr:GtrA family protein [Candidatus Yanofskybacteria bacterium]
MHQFSRKDFYFSVITGLITGLIAWRIFVFLELPEFVSVSYAWLIIFVPILWILGVNLGYFLGRWLAFFGQFGKFSAVGFTNAAVYFGILNVLISWSDINKGLWYSIFVASAFIIATFHSYFWNKFWVFSQPEVDPPLVGVNASGEENKINAAELGKFFTAYIIAGLVNIGIASGLVNFLDPMFDLSSDQWANAGGIAGSAAALVVSFIGVKMTVFRK